MNAIQKLLTDHINIWTAADTGKKSGRGRASSHAGSVYGIRKLRELILELAVRGKLVPQDQNDEPASELLKRIQGEKAKLIAEGKLKKDKPFAPIAGEEKPFNLPLGWHWTRFSEYASDIATGPFGSMIHQSDYVHGGVPLINPSHMIGDKIIADESVSVSKVTAKALDTYAIYEGDIVMARRGEVGRIALVTKNENGWLCGTGSFVLRFCTEVSRDYLRVFFRCGYARTYLAGEAVGTTMVNLNHGILKKMPLALPSIAEQLRIVAKVDELMALCDQLEDQHTSSVDAHEKLVSHLLGTLTHSQSAQDFSTNWQRIAEHFDTLFTTEASIDALKQTLLQLAVMGKLVPQDANDEPASELLKRIHAEKAMLIAEGKSKKDKTLAAITEDEKTFELPQSWTWVRVSEIAELITSGSRDWAKYLSDDGAKFITMGNLSRGSYELRLENMRYVNPPPSGEGSRTKLEANDLLISITGDVGNLGRIPEGFGDAYINQHTCLLRFLSQCRNRYFPEVMRSPMASLQFNAPQRGIKNSFRLGDLDEMVIPLPPLEEQHRIVVKVDELMALCNQLKFRITDATQLQQKLADVMVEQSCNEFRNGYEMA